MAGSSETGSSRTSCLVSGAEEGRRLLQTVLVQLQEQEKKANAEDRLQLMQTTEELAKVVGDLYRVGKTGGNGAGPRMASAYERLLQTLEKMDPLHALTEEKRTVASALAMLYAVGAGPRSSCPPPRRSSTSMLAVSVPDLGGKKRAPSSPAIEIGEISEEEIRSLDLEGLVDLESQAPGSDRRIHLRVAFEVEVGLVSETHFFAGMSMDVSSGGLFIATYRLQPVGSEVAVTFVLPNGYAVTTNAVVRWVREDSEEASPGMGVALSLSEEDQKQVEAFCVRRQPLLMDLD